MLRFIRSLALLLLLINNSSFAKIVGLIRVKNTAPTIEQHLKALACYTDALVVLNNASEDKTAYVVKSLQDEYNIEKILHKSFWYEDDAADYNRLLAAGREIGGTHFIVLHQDEMFTANCQENSRLRESIVNLQPGDHLVVNKIQLWEVTDRYRVDGAYTIEAVAFCDDGIVEFDGISRMPKGLSGQKLKLLPFHRYGLLSFEQVNWANLQLKSIWHKCFERIAYLDRSAVQLNKKYAMPTSDFSTRIMKTPNYWFDSYPFLDKTLYQQKNVWYEEQVKNWVHQYGQDFFEGLGFMLHAQ